MNISNKIDFYLEAKHSNKKNIDYYCISIKLDEKYFPIVFLSKDTYNILSSKLK